MIHDIEMLTIAHVAVIDYDCNAYISICTASHNVHVFKYNDDECTYDIFTTRDDVQEFLKQPLKKQ